MQADVFRVCALWAEGGLYIDADLGCRGHVA
ncbi:MAG: glycosyltransferase, partial [Pseudomonadota bacterium]